MFFADRLDAGRRVAARLQHLRTERWCCACPAAACRSRPSGEGARRAAAMSSWSGSRGLPFQPELGIGAQRVGPAHRSTEGRFSSELDGCR